MKIAAFTIGDINRASSRLRSFYLFDLAEKFDLEVSRPSRYRDALGVDVVHIQKKLTIKTIPAVAIYRLLGIKVIFDIDDQPVGKKAFLGYFLALFFSSVITVDTEARKQYWASFFFRKIVVINDIADSINRKLEVNNRRCKINSHGFFWIGYSDNIGSIESFIGLLKKHKRYKLTVATEKKAIPLLKLKYPSVDFISWFDGIANDDCIDAKFMLLNHNHDAASRLKSDNKMVLAILSGFLPMVSRTDSYENLANALGANFLMFDNVQDSIVISKKLSSLDFESFFQNSLTFISENYSREAVLSDFNQKVICR